MTCSYPDHSSGTLAVNLYVTINGSGHLYTNVTAYVDGSNIGSFSNNYWYIPNNTQVATTTVNPGAHKVVLTFSGSGISGVNGDSSCGVQVEDIFYVAFSPNGGADAPGTQYARFGGSVTIPTALPTKAPSTATPYTVTFNGNNGTVDQASAISYNRTLSKFNSWNTNSSGTGSSAAPGAVWTLYSSYTLYAIWDNITARDKIYLPSASRSGYKLKGYGTSADATTLVNNPYVPSADTTLYAIWEPDEKNVKYKSGDSWVTAPLVKTKVNNSWVVSPNIKTYTNFSIESTPYNCLAPQTWVDWINSAYNTDSLSIVPWGTYSFSTWDTQCYNARTNTYGYGSSTNMYYTTIGSSGPRGVDNAIKVYLGTGGLDDYPYVYFNSLGLTYGNYKTLSFDYYPTSRPYLEFYNITNFDNGDYATWTNGKLHGASNGLVIIPVELNKWNHITLTLKKETPGTSAWGYCRIGDGAATGTTSEYWLFANFIISDSQEEACRYYVMVEDNVSHAFVVKDLPMQYNELCNTEIIPDNNYSIKNISS